MKKIIYDYWRERILNRHTVIGIIIGVFLLIFSESIYNLVNWVFNIAIKELITNIISNKEMIKMLIEALGGYIAAILIAKKK